MLRMRPPKIPEKFPPVLTTEDLQKLIAACKGPAFADLRDEAIVRVFIDTGARLSEIANLRLVTDGGDSDIDLDIGELRVLGKGSTIQAPPDRSQDHQGSRSLRKETTGAPGRRRPLVLVVEDGASRGFGNATSYSASCEKGRASHSSTSIPPHLQPPVADKRR